MALLLFYLNIICICHLKVQIWHIFKQYTILTMANKEGFFGLTNYRILFIYKNFPVFIKKTLSISVSYLKFEFTSAESDI